MRIAVGRLSLLSLLFALAFSGSAARAQNADSILQRVDQLKAAGRYDAAMIEAQKLESITKQNGTQNRNYSIAIASIASILQLQGRYPEAEPLFKNALAIIQNVRGPDHPDVALALNDLAELYDAEARYSDAEPLLKRAVTINEKAGPESESLGNTLSNLAWLYYEQGRYEAAETLDERALTIVEKVLGPEHQNVAAMLGALAIIYNSDGRYADAEPLFKRVPAVYKKVLGPDSPAYAIALNNLASFYHRQHRFGDAEPLQKQALAIDEKALGSDSLGVAHALADLAALYDDEGRYSEAQPLYNRSILLQVKILGSDHPDIALAAGNFANCYLAQRRFSDAEPLFKRALAIREKTFEADHPDVIVSLNDMARFYLLQGRYGDALSYSRQATSAILSRASTEGLGSASAATRSDVDWQIMPFLNHVAALSNAAGAKLGSDVDFGEEAFIMGQWSEQSLAAKAVQQMAVRTAAGTGPLAALVRESQDVTAQRNDLDKRMMEAASNFGAKHAQSTIETLRKDVVKSEDRLTAINAQLAKDFPDYAVLTKPQPLTVGETQKLLGADEALVFWVLNDKASTVFAVTHSGFEWHNIKIGKSELANKAAAFRHGLSVEELTNTVTPSRPSALFDLNQSYELYEILFTPVEALIKDKHQLLVVPSGPLTSLPIHLLVTEKPAIAVPDITDLKAYREAAWLLKRQAISVLPSVSSFKELRNLARHDSSAKPLVGFGNPTFHPGTTPNGAPARKFTAATRSYSDYWSGLEINREALASGLQPLPATADELKAVAADVGAPVNDVYLGPNASETTVKKLPLSNYRIVYFATHALVAGDVKGLGEPALALAIPQTPTTEDDGLLTASEVAELKLNADWVVLSACNTAAGDKPGAEALSGLARSFFYAGARAMLVSHWDVGSDAATRLMTSTFDVMKSDPKLGKAEALRQAMLKYLDDKSDPWSAHPAFWGPFSLIGEGSQ